MIFFGHSPVKQGDRLNSPGPRQTLGCRNLSSFTMLNAIFFKEQGHKTDAIILPAGEMAFAFLEADSPLSDHCLWLFLRIWFLV